MDTTQLPPRACTETASALRGGASLRRGIAAIAPLFTPHRLRLCAIAALAVTAATLSALEPLVLKQLFDGLSASASLRGAALALLLLAAILLGGELLQNVLEWLVWRVRLALDYALMQATIERLHSLPLAYHREQSVGATMTKIERGIQGCMTAFSDVVVKLAPALIYLVVSVVVMLRLEWRLSLAVMLFTPLPAIVSARAAKEQTAREQGLLARWTKVFARFNEVLAGIVVVKSFTMEEREKRRFLGGVRDANGLVLRGVATDAKNNARKNVLMVLARLLALGVGGVLVMRREITLGTLVAFVSYLGGVIHPLQTLTGLYQTLRRATVSLDALLSILQAQDSLGDDPEAYAPAPFRGAIEFERVSFQYRPGAPLLHDIELRVRPGELVALVGPSGTGKTTLMALLQRLYDPSAGSIRIDGQDIRKFKHARCAIRSASCCRTARCSATRSPTTLRSAAPAPRARRSRPPRAPPTRTTSSPRCPTATTHWSASAAANSRAASASASRLRARCSRTRRSWCSTKPPPRSTPKPKRRCRKRWCAWCKAAPRS